MIKCVYDESCAEDEPDWCEDVLGFSKLVSLYLILSPEPLPHSTEFLSNKSRSLRRTSLVQPARFSTVISSLNLMSKSFCVRFSVVHTCMKSVTSLSWKVWVGV